MDHKATLEEMNKASLLKLEEYIKAKSASKEEDHQKVHQAKENWQYAWNKLMESLLVLERLEI
jgi:hypothetical protein